MLERNYQFKTEKSRKNAKYRVRYKRRDGGPNIVRRFLTPEMAYTRFQDLMGLKLFSLEYMQLSSKGNWARVETHKKGVIKHVSILPHHKRRASNWVIEPKLLDPEKKWLRNDIKAKYGIEYFSKNRSN